MRWALVGSTGRRLQGTGICQPHEEKEEKKSL